MVDLADRYVITSNRESGFGRYDTCRKEGPIKDGRIPYDLRTHQRASVYLLEPKDTELDAFIIEFKVFNPRKDKSLENTVEAALTQIEEKHYETELVKKGIPAEEIAFIHDAKSDAQREALFKDMRSGRKKILIGSTDQCGTGVNVQTHITAMHHIDCPWVRPEVA